MSIQEIKGERGKETGIKERKREREREMKFAKKNCERG